MLEIGYQAGLSIAGTGVGLVKILLLTRFLPKEAFGAVTFAWVILALADLLVLPGLNQAVLQFSSKDVPGILRAAIWAKLRWFPLVLTGGAIWAAYWGFGRQEPLTGILIVVGFALFPGTHILTVTGFHLIGRGQFRLQAVLLFGIDLLSLLVALVAVFILPGPSALIFFAGDALVRGGAMGAATVRSLRQERGQAADPEGLAQFRRFTKQMSGISLISSLEERADSMILGTILGPAAFSDFALAFQFRDQFKLVWMAYYKTAYRRYARAQPKEAWALATHDLPRISIGFGVLIGGFLLAAPVLIPFLFSSKYSSSLPLIIAVQTGLWLLLPGALLETVLRAREQIKAQYFLRSAMLLFAATATPALVLWQGIPGAAASRVLHGAVFTATAAFWAIKARRENA